MAWKPPPRRVDIPAEPDDRTVRVTLAKCSIALAQQLSPLTTANKNRVILALVTQLNEQLEVLETDLAP